MRGNEAAPISCRYMVGTEMRSRISHDARRPVQDMAMGRKRKKAGGRRGLVMYVSM